MTGILPCELQRLRLRALRRDDLDAFLAYRSDPGVARYQGWAPMTGPEAVAFLEAQAGLAGFPPAMWSQCAIADLRTDALIGDMGICLSADSSQAEFGLSITPAAQGKGYGSESVRGLIGLLFSATPVTEVTASTDIRNAACLAVLANAGMGHVDTRQAEYKGEPCTEQVFSVRRLEGRQSVQAD